MGMMKQKLDEMERLEEEYREVKNRIEILRKSLVETVDGECIKFDLSSLDKIVLKNWSQKLSDIAIEYMDKFVLGCDNEIH